MTNKQSFDNSTIVKLGGSIITLQAGKFDIENTYSLAKELKKFGKPVIVIHGGGSFTKRVVLEHKIDTDFLSSRRQKHIIKQFRTSIKDLNDNLLSVFRDVGLQCTPIVSHTTLTSRNGEIITNAIDIMRHFGHNTIPVLYGDIIVDHVREYYACSSDQIASYFARAISPKSVFFLTDVDGIYEDYPPKSKATKPLPIVNTDTLTYMRHNYTVGYGDMHGKLVQAVACTPFTKQCRILNGRVPGNLLNALQDRNQLGTQVI